MEFPHYNCFPAVTKLIVGSHALHASKSTANVVVVLKVRNFDVFYLQSFHVRDITRMCVKI